MVRLGRRGDLSMVYDALMSALFIGIFVIAVFPYIFQHANGEAYFSRFYAADLATSADLVNAGYGDVVLRYDNLKQNLDLTFWFSNGEINVWKTPVYLTTDTIVDAVTPDTSPPKPPVTTDAYYGKARRYAEGGAMRAGDAEVITKPAFLVLRKFDGAFAITEAETTLKDCPATEPVVQRKDARISLAVAGHNAERVEARAAALLRELNLPVEDEGNIRISVTWNNGNSNSIETQPTSVDGKAFSCLFARRLHSLTLVQFAENEPSSSGTAFDVEIALSTSSPVTEEQVAQAIANALAVYYR